MTKIALCSILAFSTVFGSLAGKISRVKTTTGIDGDLLGAAQVTCTNARSEDVGNTIEINANKAGNSDMSGTGIYFRMKNLSMLRVGIWNNTCYLRWVTIMRR